MTFKRVARAAAPLVALLAGASLSACGGSSASGAGAANSSTSQNSTVDAKAQAIITQAVGQVHATGPNGEPATAASAVQLTPAEIAKIKAKHATAAIVLHYGGNDWSRAQVAGQKHEFSLLGIKVIGVTDANFVATTQVQDIQAMTARKPSVIVSIPTDPVVTAPAYRAAAKAGIKLVFMDNIPQGFKPGVDYVSDVSADNYDNGVVSAALMAKELGGKGQIGVIWHNADFFVTKQRYQGFKNTVEKDFPGIKIVASQGIAGPDFQGDADKAANSMLTQHPDLNGIWAVWDVPGQGVLEAARSNGRGHNLIIATQDLGTEVALNMAQGGDVKDLGAQRPYDQGVTEAKLAGYALLGKKAPPYVVENAVPVTKANVLQAWHTVYESAPPASLTTAAKG